MKKFARFKIFIGEFQSLKNGLLGCLMLLSFSLSGQTDSVYAQLSIPEATIRDLRFNRTGYSSWEADSLPGVAVISLTNRLFSENGLLLRQNAPGTLATVSARGAGPNRTAVLWNGLSLQSPMNGVVDASLVPLWQGDKLEVLQGGNSAAQSNGAMGGSILIETPFQPLRSGLSGNFGAEGGSFGMQSAQGDAAYAQEKISSRLRFLWQTADNDFSIRYRDLNGQPIHTKQQNNFAEKTDVQQFNQILFNKRNVLKTAAWYQHSFRQIPPAITESVQNTWQRDWSAKAVATWDFNRNKYSRLRTHVAWQDEFIGFHFAGKTEESRAQTATLGSEWRQKAGRLLEWRLGVTAQQLRATSDGYKNKGNWYDQTRLAGYAQGERSFAGGGKVSAMLRQDWAQGQGAPFTWTLGLEIPTGKTGLVHGHVSRNFNLPTFNDRFWETLDSSILKPEKGYSADLGWKFNNHGFTAEVTGFQLILDDWILWQPSAVDGIFRPGNLRKVNSRGLEAAGGVAFHLWGIKWKTKVHGQWSETRNVAVYGGSTAVLGKQLPYTPKISIGSGLWAEYGGFSAAYLHQFSGQRFVTTDNNIDLPGYQTGSIWLSYAVKNGPWNLSRTLTLHLAVDNLWNSTYESLENRPMPGRNWRLGLLLGW